MRKRKTSITPEILEKAKREFLNKGGKVKVLVPEVAPRHYSVHLHEYQVAFESYDDATNI